MLPRSPGEFLPGNLSLAVWTYSLLSQPKTLDPFWYVRVFFNFVELSFLKVGLPGHIIGTSFGFDLHMPTNRSARRRVQFQLLGLAVTLLGHDSKNPMSGLNSIKVPVLDPSPTLVRVPAFTPLPQLQPNLMIDRTESFLATTCR